MTGGYVYRGSVIPELFGTYLYGDYCSGEIWGARPAGGGTFAESLPMSGDNLTTFGEDAAGELYVGTDGGLLSDRGPGPTPVIDAVTPAAGYERGSDGDDHRGGLHASDARCSSAQPALAVSVESPDDAAVLSPPAAAVSSTSRWSIPAPRRPSRRRLRLPRDPARAAPPGTRVVPRRP